MNDFKGPLTTASTLFNALREVGLDTGDVVCVHAALSNLGYVCGGARTVVDTLIELLGPDGTLMMPTYTRDTADPREWQYPPAPPEWLDRLVEETPPYDPLKSPTQRMGLISELFRTYPNVRRSGHPVSSVAAHGPQAQFLTEKVGLNNRFGPESPYGRLTKIGGKILLLGAPFETMSLLHLSQYLIGWGTPVQKSACMLVDGVRQWVKFDDFVFPHDWSTDCVQAMVDTGLAVFSGSAKSHILCVDAARAVEFTLAWRKEHNY